MIYIYYLHEGNNIPIYVGKTKQKLYQRLANHKWLFKNKNLQIELVDEVEDEDWKPLECYWIEQFKQWGFKLENKNKGGGGPVKYDDINLKRLKSSWDEERKKHHSKSMKGKKHSEETKKKQSLAKKGKHFHTEKSKKKISEKMKGYVFSKERNQKIGKANSTSVLQYDLEGNFIKEWSSLTEASLKTKTNRSSISNCINNKLKSTNNFIWKQKL